MKAEIPVCRQKSDTDEQERNKLKGGEENGKDRETYYKKESSNVRSM